MALNFTTNRGWTAGKITPDPNLVTQVVAPPDLTGGGLMGNNGSVVRSQGPSPTPGGGFAAPPNPNGTPATTNSPAFLQDAINKLLETQKTGMASGGIEGLLRQLFGQQQPSYDPQIGQGYNTMAQAGARNTDARTGSINRVQQLQDQIMRFQNSMTGGPVSSNSYE